MEEKNTVKFKYIFSDDYNPVYVNGAYGGINLQGELVLHFYLERNGLPVYQSHKINKDGKIGSLIEGEPEDLSRSKVRFIQNGLILNLTSAKTIHKWLGQNIKKLEQIFKQETKKEGKNKK